MAYQTDEPVTGSPARDRYRETLGPSVLGRKPKRIPPHL